MKSFLLRITVYVLCLFLAEEGKSVKIKQRLAGDTIKLRCRAQVTADTQGIKWIPPESASSKDRLEVTRDSLETVDNVLYYVKAIKVVNATTVDTGYFTCMYQQLNNQYSNSSSKTRNVVSSYSRKKKWIKRIYIYVYENLHSTGERRSTTCASIEGLLEGNQCIKYGNNDGEQVNFAEAERRCHAMNCELIEITSDAMQRRVDNHVRATWEFVRRSYEFFWLGSSYQTANHPSKVVTLKCGREVRLSKWLPGYPRSDSSFSHMGLRVDKDAASRFNAVYNIFASTTRIPLCACNT